MAEVFRGLRREQGRHALQRSFEDLTFLEPSSIRLYFRAADIYRRLCEIGHTVRSTVDCVIAVIAEENGCYVLARDRDMHAILGSGALRVRRWPSEPARG